MARSREAQGPPGPRLDTLITFLKGVGEVRAAAFRRMGIITAGDLLYHLPHRYEDATTIKRIASLEPGMEGTVVGEVISKGVIPTRKGLRLFQAVLRDDSGMIEVSWPGQPYLDRSIEKGDTLLATGPVRFYHGRQLQPREYVNLGPEADGLAEGRVLSVYPTTEKLSFKVVRSIIHAHLDRLLPQVVEYLPEPLVAWAGIPPIGEALRMVHRPSSVQEAMRGRSRLAFEELFFFQLLSHRAKTLARSARAGIAFENRRRLTSALRKQLPYELTGAQKKALGEIIKDMTSGRRMNRLLQGDVGSGKTIVALFAALLALENDYQAALMVPTELLAEQHMKTLTKLLQPLGISPILVTGAAGAKQRRETATRLGSYEPIIAIGTHALLQERAAFGRLGFVAIDEQHRFGVEQRKALTGKGGTPDVLLMSATPIPRSLALTLYGDLDVSTLDERPPGRGKITTVIRRDAKRERVFSFVKQEIERGHQAYVVYPVIAESERTDLKAAETMFEVLRDGPFNGRRVALLHGRIIPAEREEIMRRFRDGQIDVLVATTVIEVGIDVANATVMVIEHPERFGLSQLHQLRGRVGRGADESYCILLGDFGPDSARRLEVLAGTDDGFAIAQADLQLRGMGDLFGERQSGVPMFRIADPVRDVELNRKAGEAAARVLASDPNLDRPDHLGIMRILHQRYAHALELFRVG